MASQAMQQAAAEQEKRTAAGKISVLVPNQPAIHHLEHDLECDLRR
jgi:hypothetical protein